MKRLFGALIATAVALGSTGNASASPANEYALLANIPAQVLDRIPGVVPDEQGAGGFNQPIWRNVVYQRVPVWSIWIGAAENDPAKVDAGFRAIAFARRHLQPDGSFDASGPATSPSNMSFWVEAVAHALVVLQQSPLGPRYAQRIDRVAPMLRGNIDWLQRDDRIAQLDGQDRGGTNRVFVDACAFAFASRVLGDPSLMTTARNFAREANSRLRPDGTLPENGGFDSSYQAVSLLYASSYAMNFERPPLRATIGAALNRELQAIGPNGNIDVSQNTRTGRGQEMVFGKPKAVDGTSVILGLYYSGMLLDNRRAVDAAYAVYTANP